MPDKAPVQFDHKRFVRTARAEIEEETNGMSPAEIVEYYQTYPYDAPHDEIDATRLPWWGSGKLEDYDKSGGGYFDAIAFVRWVRAKHAAESLPSACGAKSYDGKRK